MKSPFLALPLLLAGSLLATPVRGVVRSVDPKAGTLTLVRDDTKETVTAFAVSGDLIRERVGTIVAADLRSSENLLRFEHLVPADPDGEKRIADAAEKLRVETRALGRNPVLAVGDTIPEFALRDQFGRVVTPAELRGKFVVINFIFTRCRAAKMCPASTTRMVALTKQSASAGLADVVFLSVSFDPGHDTPGILKTYADGYGADHAVHRFLTGPKGAIDDLRRRFGVLTRAADDTIVHNVATTLVGPDGRVLHRENGPDWSAERILGKIPPTRRREGEPPGIDRKK